MTNLFKMIRLGSEEEVSQGCGTLLEADFTCRRFLCSSIISP